MDLEKNIEIAAEVYAKEKHPPLGLNEDWKDDGFDEGYNAAAHHKVNTAFIDGAKSQAAKDFWYNEFKQTTSVGHLNHGKSIIVGETGVDDRIVASAHNIQSIVPIADIIPEPIISKQEFLEMHDKAVERSITEETYRESRAWDIKKEKKVSHKRNNKRK